MLPASITRQVSLFAQIPDLSREHQTEPAPPETHGLMAHIDATLEQQIFDLSQRQRKADVYHHREPDHFGRAVEITERDCASREVTQRPCPSQARLL